MDVFSLIASGATAVCALPESIGFPSTLRISSQRKPPLTNPLPFRHLERAHRLLICRRRPGPHGVEAHLAMPAIRTPLSAPGVILLHGRQSLGQRHDGYSCWPAALFSESGVGGRKARGANGTLRAKLGSE